jgi:hypothetical protein
LPIRHGFGYSRRGTNIVAPLALAILAAAAVFGAS